MEFLLPYSAKGLHGGTYVKDELSKKGLQHWVFLVILLKGDEEKSK